MKFQLVSFNIILLIQLIFQIIYNIYIYICEIQLKKKITKF